MVNEELQKLVERKIAVLKEQGIEDEVLEKARELLRQDRQREALEFLLFLFDIAITKKEVEGINLEAEWAERAEMMVSLLGDKELSGLFEQYRKKVEEAGKEFDDKMNQLSEEFIALQASFEKEE